MLCFLLVGYTACKKEETPPPANNACKGIICQNNGSCLNGVCQCAAGYEGQYCEKASNLRYIGNWKTTEIVTGSSKATNKNKQKDYTLKINKGDLSLDLLFDNFSNSYNGIKGILSRRYESGQLVFDNALQFVITANQTPTGSYTTILYGNGSINDAGNNIAAIYYVRYLDNSVVVNDTISVTAEYLP
ncbi:hypothetical protein CAP35_01500 [Chitinophagaceae bacterium IBVUCB1]|nr:hypothetical protein CAP35_01500 [Chitinophagaceae bacterium IBVUCB1]